MIKPRHFIYGIIVFALFFLHCAGLSKVSTTGPVDRMTLNLTIEPIFSDDEVKLKVDMKFRGGSRGKDTLVVPSAWGGQTMLYKEIRNLRPISKDTKIASTISPSVKTITYPPHSQVFLSYEVRQVSKNNLSSFRKYYRPFVEKDFIHLIGETFLVHPKWEMNKPIKVSLSWKNLPQDWMIANSFGAGKKNQIFVSTLQKIKYALYVGGNFRLHKKNVKGNPIYLAVRGNWRFKDSELLDTISLSLLTQRNFWNDHKYPYYLVTVMPSGEALGHYAGTSFTNSFALFMNTNQGINAPLKHLVMHELFHQWNGQKMKREYPEELVFWFSEGFTEYYARLLSLRSGLITLNDYVNNYNRVLYDYHKSNAKHATNQSVLAHFWSNKSINRIPYLKGDILAHNWNNKLKKGNRNLDDVMRDLLASANRSGIEISTQSVDRHMRKYMANGVRKDIETHISNGKLLNPIAKNMGPCVKLKKRNVANSPPVMLYELDKELYHQNPQACLEYFQ